MNELPNGFTGYRGITSRGGASSGTSDGARDGATKRKDEREAKRIVEDGAASSARPAVEGLFTRASALASAREGEAAAHADAEMPEASVEVAPADQRWAWVEIDTAAIRRNVVELRRCLKPRCRLAVVVKGDAYGHGAVEVAKAVLGAGADRLAVSTVPEAVELRQAGITAPILLMAQPPQASIPLLIAHQITPSVYREDFAIAYGEAADLRGMTAPFHLAVNTGMNRMGVHHEDAVEFLRQVSFHRALVLEGVFTHFATADSSESFDFDIQARRFADTLECIHNAGFDLGIIHCANTAAALRYPGVQFDMVRSGGAVLGLHPCAETHDRVHLRPAMSVHARIVDTRFVPVSEGVSYGFQYRSPGSVMICTLPIGYGDGLRRGLSGNTDVVMGGRYFRQVGAICMDECMFEVDLRPRDRIEPHVGDEVLLVGTQGIAQITLDEMAEKLGTVNYEVASGFGMRLPRIYR